MFELDNDGRRGLTEEEATHLAQFFNMRKIGVLDQGPNAEEVAIGSGRLDYLHITYSLNSNHWVVDLNYIEPDDIEPISV